MFVPSVEEARRTLARTAREVLGERKPADPDPEFFLFPPGRGGGREHPTRASWWVGDGRFVTAMHRRAVYMLR